MVKRGIVSRGALTNDDADLSPPLQEHIARVGVEIYPIGGISQAPSPLSRRDSLLLDLSTSREGLAQRVASLKIPAEQEF